MKKKILHCFLLVILGLLNNVVQAENQFPNIQNHWLRAAPPGAMMLAAYGELENTGSEDKVLIGAYSPSFKVAEIHKTVIEKGMAKMVFQAELIIKPQQTLQFKPNGLHIMLMKANKQLKVGDEVKICLIYQDGDEILVQHIMFPVVKK